ncbi:MAG: hypothetical protein LZ174_08865 [Thaumarchaeota archaeon]|jgi:hypothetical protein|nr:hypothetical protein [Candidatus Geocrenenecus arthurdayi]
MNDNDEVPNKASASSLAETKKYYGRFWSYVDSDRNIALETVGIPNALGYDSKLLAYRKGRGFEVVDYFIFGEAGIEPQNVYKHPYRPYFVEDFLQKNRIEIIELTQHEFEKFLDAEAEQIALYTGFTVLSYVQNLFDTLPYLYLVGERESGKTQRLILFASLSYRPLFGTDFTAADLYSYLADGVPLTIIEDEFQGSEKDSEKMRIYKSGYKKGARVPRITLFEGGRRIDYFPTFSLKLVAAEYIIENKGFLERCVVDECVPGNPEKDHFEEEDYERFRWLRSELLKWRMRILVGDEELPSLDFDWLRGRNRELYLPLLTVLYGSKLYGTLEEFLRKKIEEKEEARRGSLEAVVLRCSLDILNEEKNEIPFSELWNKLLHELEGEEIKTKTAVIARSMETEAYGTVSKRDVAAILRGKLGMKAIKTTREGRRLVVYIPDFRKLWKAAKRYLNPHELEKLPNYQNYQFLESPHSGKPVENGFSPAFSKVEKVTPSQAIGSFGSLVVGQQSQKAGPLIQGSIDGVTPPSNVTFLQDHVKNLDNVKENYQDRRYVTWEGGVYQSNESTSPSSIMARNNGGTDGRVCGRCIY